MEPVTPSYGDFSSIYK